MLVKTVVITRLKWRKIPFQVYSCGCWQEASVSCWLLARGHPQFLDTWVSPTQQLALLKQASQESKKYCKQDGDHRFLSHLGSDVISYHFCHILFIRSKSLVWQEEGVIPENEYLKVGILETILEAAYHRRETREVNNVHSFSKLFHQILYFYNLVYKGMLGKEDKRGHKYSFCIFASTFCFKKGECSLLYLSL